MTRENRRSRKALLLLASIVVSICVLEAASYVLYRRTPQVALYEELEAAPTDFRPTIVLHPYTGFVANPSKDDRNSHGFPGHEPQFDATDESFVIGVFGGSVAAQFCINDPLTEVLKAKSALLEERDIALVCGAVGGFKQPQQLMALNYFLLLGVEFDVVFSLDGLNEIAAQRTTAVSYLYPRNWHLMSQKGMDIEASMQLGQIVVLKQKKLRWERLLEQGILGRSNFFKLLGRVVGNRKSQQIGRAYERLDQLSVEQDLDYQTRGPAKEYDEAVFLEDSANLWRDASLLMRDISRSRDTTYIHFLQPNRYSSNKQLTERERKMHDEKKARRNGEGYRVLKQKAAGLREAGVAFYDLTPIFDDAEGDLFPDHAHFDRAGRSIMAEHIADVILDLHPGAE